MFFPPGNRKTGKDSSVIPACNCKLRSDFRARTGQQLYPSKGNRSTNSPFFSPDFGCLILTRREVGEDDLISCHVRSETGEKSCTWEANSSPSLNEPKKAVVHKAQRVCFHSWSHFSEAILCPNINKRGKVSTLLVFCLSIEATFLAPLSNRDTMGSSVI